MMPTLSEPARSGIRSLLKSLYGPRGDECLRRIEAIPTRPATPARQWDQTDAVLITYGDQVRESGRSTLQALTSFLVDTGVNALLSDVHLLPFFPYSSDDGFSVIDYELVDPALGDWEDVAGLRASAGVGLMFDLVLNHCSQQHAWFQGYLAGDARFEEFFHAVDPDTDLSAVTRPRSTPLLTPFETASGTKHVWTTFSADQVDLNFANPDVLCEMLRILLDYVLVHGARIVRLDAIAYLWKEIGTSCIHLPQTHAVVKLMRLLLDDVAAGTILLTETNVPHAENISYFGDNDEARMVYQFSLPPLLLDAMLSRDASALTRWLENLAPCAPGTTFFNFTASHDGIGVRPLEGLVPEERIARLAQAARERGGQVSTRRRPDGTDSPYELNISYLSALDEPGGLDPEVHARRFLTTQGVMLALRGIPGIYFHSLVGTPNDLEGMQRTGRARSINRRKFERAELTRRLESRGSVSQLVFEGYQRLLAARRRQPAFSPDARQALLPCDHPALLALRRGGDDAPVWVIANFDAGPQSLAMPRELRGGCVDLITQRHIAGDALEIEVFGLRWLAPDG